VEQPSVREVSDRIDSLLDDLSGSAPPPVMARVEELLRNVMTLYGSGFDRVLSLVGPEEVRRLADDDIVGNLLVLHDLHPDEVDTRVQQALETVRPYLGSHAGGVSLSSVDPDGVVHLRLEGSCDGCPSSSETVRNAIEQAILAVAPDVVAVKTEGMVEPAQKLLQIAPFEPRGDGPSRAGEWQHLELDVPPRTMAHIEVTGEGILVANLDGTLVAYLDTCPACLTGAPSAGTLDRELLTCGCGGSFDLRAAGRGADDAHLTPLPLLPERGAWKVSLPRRTSA
jgi:Fe-S cluster biogenesis protein NfuA/nitrite reductase/ring-hydroxylating ferredoxin subunit